jgi:hypothetical protein
MAKFQKGVSGNPGGRTKKARAIEQVALRHASKVIGAFVSILENSDNDTARIAAGRELLDRAYGKPAQAISGQISGKITLAWEGDDHKNPV